MLKLVTGFLDRFMWPMVMILSWGGTLLEDGVGYYDVIFWLSVAVMSILNKLSGVTLVKVVEDE